MQKVLTVQVRAHADAFVQDEEFSSGKTFPNVSGKDQGVRPWEKIFRCQGSEVFAWRRAAQAECLSKASGKVDRM